MDNILSEEELSQFKALAFGKKIAAMKMYLLGNGEIRYNMSEVGQAVFGGENYSYTVSLIHRAYNFSGNNSGRYRSGCLFEKKYHYRVTGKDIEAFVRTYPDGTCQKGITFESFLLSRLRQSGQQQRKTPSKPQERSFSYTNPSPRSEPWEAVQSTEPSYREHFSMEIQDESAGYVAYMGGAALGLLLLFVNNKLLSWWYLSLICVVFFIKSFISWINR